MKETNCGRLDGYVDRWLSDDERMQFEAHLPNCLDCRQFVEEARRLDNLLARANTAGVPVRPALIDRIDHRLSQARRRRRAAWGIGLAAAGVLLCIFAAWLDVRRAADTGAVHPPVATRVHQSLERTREPRPPVEVTFDPPSDAIAVLHKTENPSVTIIWVYPTIKADQESTPETSDLLKPPERNGI